MAVLVFLLLLNVLLLIAVTVFVCGCLQFFFWIWHVRRLGRQHEPGYIASLQVPVGLERFLQIEISGSAEGGSFHELGHPLVYGLELGVVFKRRYPLFARLDKIASDDELLPITLGPSLPRLNVGASGKLVWINQTKMVANEIEDLLVPEPKRRISMDFQGSRIEIDEMPTVYDGVVFIGVTEGKAIQ